MRALVWTRIGRIVSNRLLQADTTEQLQESSRTILREMNESGLLDLMNKDYDTNVQNYCYRARVLLKGNPVTNVLHPSSKSDSQELKKDLERIKTRNPDAYISDNTIVIPDAPYLILKNLNGKINGNYFTIADVEV